MTHLENQAARTQELVAEKSQCLLGRAFSRVFSHLLSRDPHFDFDVVLAPVPPVIQDNLAGWLDDHVDALVVEFALEDDMVVIAAEEAGVGGNDEEDGRHDASSADRDDEEGAPS